MASGGRGKTDSIDIESKTKTKTKTKTTTINGPRCTEGRRPGHRRPRIRSVALVFIFFLPLFCASFLTRRVASSGGDCRTPTHSPVGAVASFRVARTRRMGCGFPVSSFRFPGSRIPGDYDKTRHLAFRNWSFENRVQENLAGMRARERRRARATNAPSIKKVGRRLHDATRISTRTAPPPNQNEANSTFNGPLYRLRLRLMGRTEGRI